MLNMFKMSASPLGMNFLLTDDGSTLLAMSQAKDGTLELMSTPVTIVGNTSNQVLQSLTNSMLRFKSNSSDPNSLSVDNVQSKSLHSSHSISINQVHSSNMNSTVSHHLKNFKENIECDDELLEFSQELSCCGRNAPSTQNCDKQYSGKHGKKSTASKKPAKGKSKNKGIKDLYQCDMCAEEFEKYSVYQKHLHDHAFDKAYRCPKCAESFNAPLNFKLHMAIHKLGSPKCPECGRKFSRLASLKTHMRVHEIDENLYCTECDDVFDSKVEYGEARKGKMDIRRLVHYGSKSARYLVFIYSLLFIITPSVSVIDLQKQR
uniref:C2H2-type domain-containing protein n=1 Tax=Trichogramma kaykai TaxID=54128 RepID=A0ABD2W3P1_9HYME